MDDGRFYAVVKRLEIAGTSRRAGVRALAAVALVGAAGRFVVPTDAAKKRKKKAKATYHCAGSTDVFHVFQPNQRGAVLFTASRTGTLRQIKFAINNSGAFGDADWVVQLVAVAGDVPSQSPTDVLAAVTVANASLPLGETTITGSFAGTKLTKGVDYAAALTRRGAFEVALLPGVTCSGASFTADGAGAFASLANALVVSVLVD